MPLKIIRTIIFYIYIIFITLLFGTVLLPFSCISCKFSRNLGKLWSDIVLKSLSIICNIKHKVIDESGIVDLVREKMKAKTETKAQKEKHNPRIILVSKHQSTWETIFFNSYFNCPAFILKKELIFIPVFGVYMILTKMIIINRGNGVSAIRNMIKQILEIKDIERLVTIFPEGTRTKIGEREPFHRGILAIIKNLQHVIIIPVALNSGIVWPKDSWIKNPGTVTIKFLKYIEINNKDKEKLNDDELIKKLEKMINDESDGLNDG